MAQWILKANRNIVLRRTLQLLSTEELHKPVEAKKFEIFDSLVKKRWGDSITLPPIAKATSDDWEEYVNDL